MQGRTTRRWWAWSAGLLLLACAGPRAPVPGPQAPVLAATPPLVDLECRPVDLPAALASREATVLVWWGTGCPCVRRYQVRIDALATRHPGRVRVLAVSSNADEEVADVRARYAQTHSPVPLVLDLSGELAHVLGVRSTPTAVVLDAQGRVRFRGWLDNERRPGEPGREAWLEDALDALLAGRDDFRASAPVWGCAIARSLSGRARTCGPPAGAVAAPAAAAPEAGTGCACSGKAH